MKAAVNGVPSLSMLDGWWVEGCVENVTGWAIGNARRAGASRRRARPAPRAAPLREARVGGGAVLLREPEHFLGIMRHAIALNASHFNTQRMMLQYLFEAYVEHGEDCR